MASAFFVSFNGFLYDRRDYDRERRLSESPLIAALARHAGRHEMTDPQNELKLSAFTFHEQAVRASVGGKQLTLDALELGGEILVVLTWLGNTERGLRKPEYVLPLSAVAHQELSSDPEAKYRWTISAPLPQSLFDGSASRPFRRQFGVKSGPALTLPLEPTKH
ncbi:hypothetical protein [Ensifer sp.]|jgi:hypothetical protein|uniref:hypothetical protein n=1 Tax=Ensifer sp. TaxID=1872086 RepID=UPI002E167C2B|nr:hypothetical protein [Ensifer sp.]